MLVEAKSAPCVKSLRQLVTVRRSRKICDLPLYGGRSKAQLRLGVLPGAFEHVADLV